MSFLGGKWIQHSKESSNNQLAGEDDGGQANTIRCHRRYPLHSSNGDSGDDTGKLRSTYII